MAGTHRRQKSLGRLEKFSLALLLVLALVIALVAVNADWSRGDNVKSVAAAPSSVSTVPERLLSQKQVKLTPEVVNDATPPVSLTIPSIDVATSLLSLGLNSDGGVEVPADAEAAKAGWFNLGTLPGNAGSAVVVGHVDSKTGPAVFYRLRELSNGSKVVVTQENGVKAQFKVTSVKTYANEDFPAEKIYAGSTDKRVLNLITCGGAYDAARGGYQSNVVVTTELDQASS